MVSQISLRPGTEADIPLLMKLAEQAFGTNAIHLAMFPPEREPDDAKRYAAEHEYRIANMRKSMGHPRKPFIVATAPASPENDGAQNVVGWAGWEVLEPDSEVAKDGTAQPGDSLEVRLQKLDERAKSKDWPAALDLDAVKEYITLTETSTEKVLGKDGAKGMWTLNAIAVHPGHQRKGIGKVLLQWGIDRARKDRRDIYLLSQPAGRALYLGAGFEELGEVEMWGVPQYQMMLKYPRD